jgi:peptidoglycan hydrolase-like protein with peptidoglycan-binding domain
MALSTGVKLSELNQNDVLQLQNLLKQAGFDPGASDGIMGPKTQAAYKRFLVAQGQTSLLNVTSTVVQDLVARLASNEVPELWQGVVQGGEFNAQTAPAFSSAGTPAAVANTTPAPAAATTATTSPAQGSSSPDNTPVPASDGTTEEYVRKNFPHLSYLLDADPEVREVMLRAKAGQWTLGELQGELNKTQWWATTQASARVWDQKWYMDRASAQNEWDRRTLEVENQARVMGAPVDHEGAQWLAGKVLREGWSDAQLKKYLGDTIRGAGGATAGTVTEKAASFKGIARNYLMSMTDTDATEYATRVAEGSLTDDAVQTMMRQQAKGRFHWLAPQIDGGLTPADLFRSTQDEVARLLEVSRDSIDLSSPKWSALTSPVMENNQARSMNFGEAQKWARQQVEWQYTKNANVEANRMGLGLLKALGAIA